MPDLYAKENWVIIIIIIFLCNSEIIIKGLILFVYVYGFRWCSWVLWYLGSSVAMLPTNMDVGRSDDVLFNP